MPVESEPAAAVEVVRAVGVVGAAVATALGAAAAARAAHARTSAPTPATTPEGDVMALRDDQLVRIVEESIRTLQSVVAEERTRARRLETEITELRQELRSKELRIEELERGHARMREELSAAREELAAATGRRP